MLIRRRDTNVQVSEPSDMAESPMPRLESSFVGMDVGVSVEREASTGDNGILIPLADIDATCPREPPPFWRDPSSVAIVSIKGFEASSRGVRLSSVVR